MKWKSGGSLIGIVILVIALISLAVWQIALANSATITFNAGAITAGCTGPVNQGAISWSVPDANPNHFWRVTVSNITQGTSTSNAGGPTTGPVSDTQWLAQPIPGGTVAGDILQASFQWSPDNTYATSYPGASASFCYVCDTGVAVACSGPPGGGTAGGAVFEPPPPSADIFLSDVCEPFDGFSVDGWMTWNTNAVRDNLSWQLYVGSSIDGPWIPVQGSPPWIVNLETMNMIAQAVGVADYHDVWMMVEGGKPVHVGSAIIGRDYRMLELCGGELPAMPVSPAP